MLLKKVKLRNFRQYLGVVEFRFAVDSKKNVTIIHGENGVGKTALLNAIKWAFFGTVTSNFRNPKNLISEAAKKTGIKKCTVEIEFSEDGRDFLLIRTFDEAKQSKQLKVFEMKDDVWSADLPEPDQVINNLLPREMAEYFFFQGEGSNAVDSGNSKGNLAVSIRDILGFRVAETLIKTLKKHAAVTRKKIAAHDKSGESSKLNSNIQDNEKKLEIFKANLSNAEKKVVQLESEFEQVENKLAGFSNHNLQVLRKQEKESENQLKIEKRNLKQTKAEKILNIAEYGWAVFGKEFAEASLGFIDESQLKGRLPEPYNRTFIEDILSEATCVCGSDLKEGSKAYKRIISLLDKAANPLLLQRLSGVRAQIESIRMLSTMAKRIIENTSKLYDDYDEKIQQLQLKLKNLNEQISSIPEEEIAKLQRIKNNLKRDLSGQNQIIGGSKSKITQIQSYIKASLSKLEAIKGNSDVVNALVLKKDFEEELSGFLSEYLEKMEKNIRAHVINEVNETLKKFSRHDFHIQVTEAFKIHLRDKDNNEVGQGDGLNLLLNLTITAALINFAAERKKVKDPILNSATVAPLVIDAPFGVLDTKYRNVVVNQLPEYANQVIFLVSSSQWTAEMEAEISHRIGAEYCLILEESAQQNDKELDKIIIREEEIIMSHYGCDNDRTVVQEIAV